MPRKLSATLREQVRRRAAYLCEYCHTNERWQYVRFTIDHLIPLSEAAGDAPENLALACFHCNRRKSEKLSATDSETGELTPLFNPRQHRWSQHFIWSADGLRIIPQTTIGRVTVELLELNRQRILAIRFADAAIGRHPPADDPIQRSPIGPPAPSGAASL